jgi:hypothetical protein
VKIWGASETEVAQTYPCDAIAFPHDDVYFRAVAIDAPAQLVFRWLCQLRAAPYSYDWIDNLGRRSPPQLTPGLDHLRIGQRIMRVFRVVSFEPGQHLTIASGLEAPSWLVGDIALSYRLYAAARGTRLVAKVLVAPPPGLYGRLVAAVLPILDLVFMRKQFLTLRHYAERDARATTSEAGSAPFQ